jgi:hypothetical protein
MGETVFSFATMRQEHQDWQSEHAGWLADNERWQAEHKAALEALHQIEQGLRDHEAALAEHNRTTRAHDEAITAHEQAMQKYEQQGGQTSFQESLAKSHRTFGDRQVQQREAHARIKRHHDKVVSRLAELKDALEEGV